MKKEQDDSLNENGSQTSVASNPTLDAGVTPGEFQRPSAEVKELNMAQKPRDDEKEVLVVARAAAILMAPGSTFKRFCERCFQRVMIAPTGQKLLLAKPGMRIVCMECLRANDMAKGVRLAGTAEEMAREIAAARPNFFRERN